MDRYQRKDIGGAKASLNGIRHEDRVYKCLLDAGLQHNPHTKRLKTLIDSHCLFSDANAVGQFGTQIDVRLRGGAHAGVEVYTKVDFAISDFTNRPVLVSVKSQESNGTAGEKLWHEIQQLIDTQIPSCMLVYGPVCGNGREGWKRETLQMVWRWSCFHGKNILLFRTYESLNKWLKDKFPIPGHCLTHDDIFIKYCDADPCAPHCSE